MRHMRHLINLQPVHHGGAADLAFGGDSRHIEHSAALPQQ
jgi:hypothetical protein